jgi:hypothetical protein
VSKIQRRNNDTASGTYARVRTVDVLMPSICELSSSFIAGFCDATGAGWLVHFVPALVGETDGR